MVTFNVATYGSDSAETPRVSPFEFEYTLPKQDGAKVALHKIDVKCEIPIFDVWAPIDFAEIAKKAFART